MISCTGRRVWSLLAILSVSVVLAGCGGSSGTSSGARGKAGSSGGPTTTSPGSKGGGSGADPLPDASIKWADDVVVVRRTKGKTIKGKGNDGSSILLDGTNPDVKKLKVGSVMLLTGVGAGRVKQLDKVNGNVAVTFGPVELTDVVRDGDLKWDDTAIDLSTGIVNVSRDMPEVSGAAVEPAGFRLRGDDVKVKIGDFDTKFGWTPADNGGGDLQVVLTPSDQFAGSITMDVNFKPIEIGGGTRVQAGKVDFFDLDFKNLQGTAKITTELQSLQQTAALHIPPFFKVPVSVAIPVPIAGIPFTLTIGATLQIDMSFSNSGGSLKGEASFDFGGPTKFAYRGGSVSVGGTRTANAEDTLKSLVGGGGTVGLNLTAELPKIAFGLKILQTGAGVFVSNGMVNSLTILPAPVLCHRIQVASVVSGGIDAQFLGADVTFTRKAFLDKRWTFAYPKGDKRCDGD
ncbi:MAG: hypothetical protein JST73_09145 [Actinobacteria bacterium]|nr:hypothetical protein [Actinomycetota bacterium]